MVSLEDIAADLGKVRTVYFSNFVESIDNNTIAQVLWDMRDYLKPLYPEWDWYPIDTVMTVAHDALIRFEWQNEQINALICLRNLLEYAGAGPDCLGPLDEILKRLSYVDVGLDVLCDHHNAKREALEQILKCLETYIPPPPPPVWPEYMRWLNTGKAEVGEISTGTPVIGRAYLAWFCVPVDYHIERIYVPVSWTPSAGLQARLAIHNDNVDTPAGSSVLWQSAALNVPNRYIQTDVDIDITKGLFWFGVMYNKNDHGYLTTAAAWDYPDFEGVFDGCYYDRPGGFGAFEDPQSSALHFTLDSPIAHFKGTVA